LLKTLEGGPQRAHIRARIDPNNTLHEGGPGAHFFITTDVDSIRRVEDLIAPSLRDMGYELVRVMLRGRQRPTLEVMAERVDRAAMTVDDCAGISRAVSALLDVEDPLPGAYVLEVTSPGIDRPLTLPRHWRRNAGRLVKVRTQAGETVLGRITSSDDEAVRLDVDGSPRELALAQVAKAHVEVEFNRKES